MLSAESTAKRGSVTLSFSRQNCFRDQGILIPHPKLWKVSSLPNWHVTKYESIKLKPKKEKIGFHISSDLIHPKTKRTKAKDTRIPEGAATSLSSFLMRGDNMIFLLLFDIAQEYFLKGHGM